MYESNDKMVSHPSHYQSESGLEVIDVIEAFTSDLNGIDATWIYNCMVELRWFYYGEYSILIKPGEKCEDVKANKMPKTYLV